ncbi:MAG: hypothetical protein GY821_16160 [Gammaproteobacteria bacterium]|nr:hypothetical protein [Gammaproteobacteria bacterium]
MTMTFSWLTFICIFWAGLVLGISFIATPVKFMAPHLTMPVALEVGKATFHTFNRIEWVMLGLMLIAVCFNTSILRWCLVGSLMFLMTLETFWLLSALDVRANRVIATGEQATPGSLHWFYIIADSLKIIILLLGAWWISVGS